MPFPTRWLYHATVYLLINAIVPARLLDAQQQAPPPRPRELKQLAPGILGSAAPLFMTDSVPRYHIEIRDLMLGPKQNAPDVPLTGFTVMELRSGAVEVSVNGKVTRQEGGGYWLVPTGARVAIRNLAEVSFIRTVTLTPR